MCTSRIPSRLLTATIVLAAAIAGRVSAGAQTEPPAADKTGAASTAAPVSALTDSGWPRVVVTNDTRLTVHQPQVDSWDGFRLEGRAAVAVAMAPAPVTGASPTYGIVTFTARANVDREACLMTLEQITITSASFPGAPQQGRKWASILQASAKLKPIALERFEAALGVTAAQQRGESVPVNNAPPDIIVSTVPAMLVFVDGEPVYREVKGTPLQRILNTRPLVLRDADRRYFLKIFDGWMQAPSLDGVWTVAASVPDDSDTALKAVVGLKIADLLVGGDPKDPKTAPSLKKQAPKIVVATKPTELLVFEGDPRFVPLAGTNLVYADNTRGRLFVDVATQRAYVLATGRWFDGPSNLEGPWRFVPGGELPKDFSQIPDDSPVENVKASIPGTEQAREALVANMIPQTAQVTRSGAVFAPNVDGAPALEPIAGTTLRYVANASQPIVAFTGSAGTIEYFGVQNAVWFASSSLDGPWLVATKVPELIYSIPTSSPLHFITYAKIYDYTPDRVIVGYTPGYTGAYVSDGCIVYGTGYSHRPWIGTVW